MSESDVAALVVVRFCVCNERAFERWNVWRGEREKKDIQSARLSERSMKSDRVSACEKNREKERERESEVLKP